MSSRRLRIGIDAHAIGERRTGNERFVANLIPALRDISHHDLVLFFTDKEAASAWRARRDPGSAVRVVRPANPFVRIPLVLPALAVREGLDVLLVQYHGPPVLRCPLVTVVHDVAFAVHPEYFDRFTRLYMSRIVPLTMRRSAGVITVSEFSKAEIQRVYRVPGGKISVAGNGVDPTFLDPAPRPAPVEPPFFLAVGNLQPRKNLVTLIRAYRMLLERHPDTPERLVIVGQEWFGADLLYRQTEDLRRAARVVFTGYVPDRELAGLFQRATAFAFPSVYEGFGLPVVEAMAAGAPALVSDIQVMREVAGEDCLRLPPTDPIAWMEGLHRIAGDPNLRADLIERGRRRASGYTWDACARIVLACLERAAGPSSAGSGERPV